jgi:hypothetical protein
MSNKTMGQKWGPPVTKFALLFGTKVILTPIS